MTSNDADETTKRVVLYDNNEQPLHIVEVPYDRGFPDVILFMGLAYTPEARGTNQPMYTPASLARPAKPAPLGDLTRGERRFTARPLNEGKTHYGIWDSDAGDWWAGTAGFEINAAHLCARALDDLVHELALRWGVER